MTTLRQLPEIENLNKLVLQFSLALRDYQETIPNLESLGSLPFNETIRKEMLAMTEAKLLLLSAQIEEYGFTTGMALKEKTAE